MKRRQLGGKPRPALECSGNQISGQKTLLMFKSKCFLEVVDDFNDWQFRQTISKELLKSYSAHFGPFTLAFREILKLALLLMSSSSVPSTNRSDTIKENLIASMRQHILIFSTKYLEINKHHSAPMSNLTGPMDSFCCSRCEQIKKEEWRIFGKKKVNLLREKTFSQAYRIGLNGKIELKHNVMKIGSLRLVNNSNLGFKANLSKEKNTFCFIFCPILRKKFHARGRGRTYLIVILVNKFLFMEDEVNPIFLKENDPLQRKYAIIQGHIERNDVEFVAFFRRILKISISYFNPAHFNF
ncbi:hypothetical protein EGR_08388 [Echinococcus granulosus]|uniref:Uncharacterized protein n=1 Tax=Echinococcus granulosus TaxID=6210 RepID=W6U6E1_ECHGR|nr:hypothetical protein EGR_08388 [Echinococcus granulosus]EUB56745.1 hypothetical protein EGR_08388 [Echinococcus granulosus]